MALIATLALATPQVANASSPLFQGMPLKTSTGSGNCALSIADNNTAYTALHCGHGLWKVGDTVKAPYGNITIGTISALGSDLPEGQQLDVVRIDLAPGATIRDTVRRGDSSQLREGDAVHIKAPGNRARGTVTLATPTRENPFNRNDFPSALIRTDIVTYSGNSGGPLLTDQEELVGVLSGGNASTHSWYTPLHLIEQSLG